MIIKMSTVTKKTLVILAAGIGTRYSGGIKQLEPVGPNGEIIIDYSIHDAIAAGFKRIIFIIRVELEEVFRKTVGDRIEAICKQLDVDVAYAYQEIDDIPISIPANRIKPWGTGHAVLCCDGLIDGSFTVINADDYYGKKCFEQAAAFLDTGAYGLVG